MQCSYVVVVYLNQYNIGPSQWKVYRRKGGPETFQIDLGIGLLNYAIAKEWDGKSEKRPDWMRKVDFVPCDCEKCFFCLK